MNSVQVKVSTFLSVILISGGGLAPSVALAANLPVGDTTSLPANHALLMRAAGEVIKADMIDESKELLGEPQPAKVNDLLAEGSVLGTGKNSWAEIKWASVVSRIWQQTVIQIRPSKRSVFLQEGSLRFQLKKDRPDKAPYDIRTKVLQARVHGTTVYVECRKDVEKISVLEGNIDVVNLQNKSVVHLTPGVVYEVRVLGTLKTPTHFNLTAPNKTEATPDINKKPVADLPDIRLNPKKGEVIFQDKFTKTLAYTANSKAILDDPMIGGENPIPSYQLIQDAVAKVPGFSLPDSINEIVGGKPDRNIIKNFKIVAVPSTTAYMIGPNVGNGGVALPQIAYTDLHPVGTVPNLENVNSVVQASARVISAAPLPAMFGRPVSSIAAEEFPTTTTSYLLNQPGDSVKIGEVAATRAIMDRPPTMATIERTTGMTAALPHALPVFQQMPTFNAPPTQVPIFSNPISNVSATSVQTSFTAGVRGLALPQAPAATPFSSPINSGVLSDRRSGSDLVNINIMGGRTN